LKLLIQGTLIASMISHLRLLADGVYGVVDGTVGVGNNEGLC
jgi:hypothetical protein